MSPADGGFAGLRGHRCDCLGTLVLRCLTCGFPGEGWGRLSQREGALPVAPPLSDSTVHKSERRVDEA